MSNTAVAVKVKSNRSPQANPRPQLVKSTVTVDYDAQGKLAAIERLQGVVEFDMEGYILRGNANFLNALGYTSEDEVRGKHHDILCTPEELASSELREQWSALRRGETVSGTYMRIGREGKVIWIEATYNPIPGADGKPFKIVRYSSNITKLKMAELDAKGKFAAIGRSQAIIEFALDGTILEVNENFLKTMGYTAEEVVGKKHSMFMSPEEQNTAEYQEFWKHLKDGNFHSDTYRRIGKGGREVWLQSTYNPISGMDGKPVRVVKIAHNVTGEIEERKRVELLEKTDHEKAIELQQKANILLQVVAEASAGNLVQSIPVEGDDVTGQIAAGLRKLLGDLRESMSHISQTASGVASSSEELSAISQQLTTNSLNASEQANSVSSGSEQVSANVSIVAASSEEMLASIREISKSATEASRVAKAAVERPSRQTIRSRSWVCRA